MKIAEIKCTDCNAEYETLENVSQEVLKCPGCGSKKLKFKKTEREFKGCGGGCGNCSSCK